MPPKILRDLGDGLILRRATLADADKLIEFNMNIHGEVDMPGVARYLWATGQTYAAAGFVCVAY